MIIRAGFQIADLLLKVMTPSNCILGSLVDHDCSRLQDVEMKTFPRTDVSFWRDLDGWTQKLAWLMTQSAANIASADITDDPRSQKRHEPPRRSTRCQTAFKTGPCSVGHSSHQSYETTVAAILHRSQETWI